MDEEDLAGLSSSIGTRWSLRWMECEHLGLAAGLALRSGFFLWLSGGPWLRISDMTGA